MLNLAPYLQKGPDMEEDVPEKIEKSSEIRDIKELRLAMLPDVEGPVLEVGPGGGWTALRLKEKYGEVTCATLFEEEVKALVSRGLDAEVADMHSLPTVWGGRFGIVHASNVLEHSPAPYVVLSEFRRVLREGGVMQITMPDASGHLHLGTERVKRMGCLKHHTFCASTETVIEMFRHVGIRFDGYFEFPVWSEGRPTSVQRVWMGTRVVDRKESWRLPI